MIFWFHIALVVPAGRTRWVDNRAGDDWYTIIADQILSGSTLVYVIVTYLWCCLILYAAPVLVIVLKSTTSDDFPSNYRDVHLSNQFCVCFLDTFSLNYFILSMTSIKFRISCSQFNMCWQNIYSSNWNNWIFIENIFH